MRQLSLYRQKLAENGDLSSTQSKSVFNDDIESHWALPQPPRQNTPDFDPFCKAMVWFNQKISDTLPSDIILEPVCCIKQQSSS